MNRIKQHKPGTSSRNRNSWRIINTEAYWLRVNGKVNNYKAKYTGYKLLTSFAKASSDDIRFNIELPEKIYNKVCKINESIHKFFIKSGFRSIDKLYAGISRRY